MLFKTDENLPVEIADLLKRQGHDAVTVADQNMAGQQDLQIAQVCKKESRTIVTLDLDFSDIRAYPPEDYHGIVVLRPAVQSISSLVRLMDQVIRLMAQEPLLGKLWIVDDSKVRIRGGSQGTP